MRGLLVSVLLVCVLAFPTPASAEACPSREHWPTAGWPSAQAEVAEAHAAEIKALEDYAFTLVGQDADRKGIRTDAVVIVQGGKLIYERYARGFDATKRHLSWSVSKSVTNALTGIAQGLGALALDDSICRHVKSAGGDACRVTVKNLLEFASGFDWKEVYEDESNQASSVLAMLYGVGRRDMAAFVASHALRNEPGTTYRYSTGDATLLAGVVDAALRPAHGDNFAFDLLFDPIGLTSATFERDGKGVFVGGSYFYATARDLAKFGFLFLNDGCWDGQRILPEGWVFDSTQVSAPYLNRREEADNEYVEGRQWWLNRPSPDAPHVLPWPDVPGDAYAARGHWGQSAAVIPSLDLVVVRYADDRESGAFDFNHFLKLAIAVGR